MTRDEKINYLKNKISMELKDPILQQGFEIICKENSELKKRLLTKQFQVDNPLPYKRYNEIVKEHFENERTNNN